VTGIPSTTPSSPTGQALPQDPDRFGVVSALGLDEVAFLREAPYYRTQFSTSIVDVKNAQLLDVVPGRSEKEPTAWLQSQGEECLAHVRYATLDLSGPYRAVFTNVLPGATQVADPFHVVKLANTKLDECRRRVQNELLAPPGARKRPALPGCDVCSPRPKINTKIGNFLWGRPVNQTLGRPGLNFSRS